MNKYLLKEATSSDVVINFVFDERQRATIQAERLKAEIDSQKNNLNDLKTNIETLKTEYDAKKKIINQLESDYTTKLNKYNSDVTYWNNKGGAPKNIYDSLTNTKNELDKSYDEINILINELQRLTTQIKTLKITMATHQV